MRWGTRLIVALALLIGNIALEIPTAHAAECSEKKWIFVREDSSTGRYGVRGKILSQYHTLETSCQGAVYTTVHHSDCSYVTCWTHVEIGLHEDRRGPIIFTEKQVSGDTKAFDEWAVVGNNEFVLFRIRGVDKPDGSIDYHMAYDLLDGAGWHNPETYNVQWGKAYPMGETEKKGAATTMWSQHRNLKYIDNTDTELDWGGMLCEYDTAPGWKWNPVGSQANDYDVVNVAGDC
jgi:hypothetical protein